MLYRIELRPAALRQARKLPDGARERVLARIDRLAYQPRGPGVRKLEGYDVVVVIRIGHRRDVYR